MEIFGSEGLFCFDQTGRLVWKKDLGQMDAGFYLVPTAQWGFGSSPIIVDGKVVVLCDVLTNSFLACFSLADGKEIWRTPREDVPTWGTPALVETPGRKQIVVNGWHFTGGYDFATGKNWFGAAGVGIGLYFTPAIDVLTGPVWFFDTDGAKALYGSSTLWSVQLDVDFDLRPRPPAPAKS